LKLPACRVPRKRACERIENGLVAAGFCNVTKFAALAQFG